MKRLYTIILTVAFAISGTLKAQDIMVIEKIDNTTVKYDVNLIKRVSFEKAQEPNPNGATTGSLNGHDWVDLGLPSGTKWATCNVGASAPEVFGDSYAWGETTTFSSSSYAFYNTSTKKWTDIGNDISGTEYDVAHVKWGASWCMPTVNQIRELESECNIIYEKRNGVRGVKITGPNGNSIFLPAPFSVNINDGSVNGRQESNGSGDYYSSTLMNEVYAYSIDFGVAENKLGYFDIVGGNRRGTGGHGAKIRPVFTNDSNSLPTPDPPNGHDWVDLGLSVKWATCNIGATSPEELGNKYAWGETEPKNSYTRDNYIDYYGDLIESNICGTSYDVAHVRWGDGWRLPTVAETRELISKCSIQFYIQNGVAGFLVRGPNGNSVFFPNTNNGSVVDVCYPTGNNYENESAVSYCYGLKLYYNRNTHKMEIKKGDQMVQKYFGQYIRPVYTK